MALEYDFYLTSGTTSLGFNFHITKDTPYERATAQFRKDQVDQSSTVGDQSLTGWWTRGQLSFHKGAGENYYEVSEGETVLNRFKDSDSIDIYSNGPGVVTLARGLDNLSIAARDVVPAPLSGGAGAYALTATDVKYTAGSGSSSLATSDAGAPGSITTSGKHYYVTNGTKIERQYDATLARTNHVTNPSFEVDTAEWTADPTPGYSSSTLTRSTAWSKYGSASLRVSGPAGTARGVRYLVSGLTVGQAYVVSAWVNVGGVAGDNVVSMSGLVATVSSTDSIRGTGERLSATFTATSTGGFLAFDTSIGFGSYPDFYVDSVMVTESPFTDDYFDGSMPGCAWTGTPNASKSTFATSTNNASVVRVTLSGGASWAKVWWAKGRLFAVDTNGYFYAVADTLATVTSTDAFWNSQRIGANWSLVDSPGAVFISDGHDIFAVTVDTSGLVPTVNTPTTVAQLPAGESVASLTYHLGSLVVATSAGVRVALVQDDKVYLGPLSIEGDFAASKRGDAWKSIVYLVGRPAAKVGNFALCAINLAEKVTDLVFSWAPVSPVPSVTYANVGASVDATGRVYVFRYDGLYAVSRDSAATSGWIETAYHRFGTLDNKWFSTALIRTGGTGGSIDISRIDADGTETALTSISVPASGASVIDLGLTSAVEKIALKFTLWPDVFDPTKTPALLGYQLRALPAPQRQRMIRVPLMLFDAETSHTGQRTGGDPVARRAALEALEMSNAVVTFNDTVSGETGTAFIEAVEVSQAQPANRGKPGGVVHVTLRVIS